MGLFLFEASILHAQADEPPKPYNFYNYGPDGEQYCWFLTALQCLYRLKPVHDLLDTLDPSKSKTPEAFRVAQTLQQVFRDMSDESKFTLATRFFPANLTQISRDVDVQKMLDAKRSREWPSDEPANLFEYLSGVPIRKRRLVEMYFSFLNSGSGSQDSGFAFFTKNINRAFPEKKAREYFYFIPFFTDYDGLSWYALPAAFPQPKSLILGVSVNWTAIDINALKGVFHAYEKAQEIITVQGKRYNLVAIGMTSLYQESTYMPIDHDMALIKYGGSWYKYDSYYVNDKNPKILKGTVPEILQASDCKEFWPKTFLYQEATDLSSNDLSSKLENLKSTLKNLHNKLIQLKSQLETLREKLET